jgi:2-methylcitrate dehydratase PrpD
MTEQVTWQPTRELSRFVAASDFSDLSEAALQAARRSLVNFLGVTIGGCRHEAVEQTIEALADLGARGEVPVLGRAERFDAGSAALVNGIASSVLDFDSTQLKKTNIHPSGPVLPALLAVAATRKISGREFVNAFVQGVEISCRLANAVFGGKNPGWHVTGVAGGIGAAVAVGKVLAFTPDQFVAAIGIAANQACGLREMYGTACKALTPGRAAQTGLLSAMMARHGFSAPSHPLEGPKGFARVFTGEGVPPEILSDLGKSFEIEFNIFKPYPCAIVVHPVIDAVSQLAETHALDAADVVRLEVDVPAVALELAGNAEPSTELECKFSVTHGAAVGLKYRGARTEHFSEEAAADPELRAIRARVVTQAAPGFRKEEARVRAVLADGRTVELHVPHAIGSLQRPMGDADIAQKFFVLARPVLGEVRAEKLLEAATGLADLDDAGMLLRI